MKNTSRLSYALLMLGIIITLLASALTTQRVALAQGGKAASVVPTLKSPIGIIVSKTPTYKWTDVPGAASYQIEVYKNSSQVFTRYTTSSICGVETCETTPANTLSLGNFKWRVRAKINGTWMGWSPFAVFIISALPTSFNTGFPNCMIGWTRKSGGEWKVNDKYMYSSGLPDKCSAVYRTNSRAYANFKYEAKMKIIGDPSGGEFPEAYMAIRMGSGVNAVDSCWYSGYLFGYSRDGKFSIWKMNNDGSKTAIQAPTPSTAIQKNLWNWTEVIAKGNQFEFYINDVLVKSFTDNSYTIGWIGFEMENHGSLPTTMYVDWAKLMIYP